MILEQIFLVSVRNTFVSYLPTVHLPSKEMKSPQSVRPLDANL